MYNRICCLSRALENCLNETYYRLFGVFGLTINIFLSIKVYLNLTRIKDSKSDTFSKVNDQLIIIHVKSTT